LPALAAGRACRSLRDHPTAKSAICLTTSSGRCCASQPTASLLPVPCPFPSPAAVRAQMGQFLLCPKAKKPFLVFSSITSLTPEICCAGCGRSRSGAGRQRGGCGQCQPAVLARQWLCAAHLCMPGHPPEVGVCRGGSGTPVLAMHLVLPLAGLGCADVPLLSALWFPSHP